MKRVVLVLLALAVAVTALVSCSSSDRPAGAGKDISGKETLKIGIIQYVSHPSLDNCTSGIIEGLKSSELYEKMTIDVQIGSDASPDADCQSYAGGMVAKGYDLIFAVATPAASTAFAATESIPVVFCAVSDPEAAGLVKASDAPYYNATGTSDVLDLSAQLDLIAAMQPTAKKIGILYTTSEANSISNLRRMRELAEERNITIDAVGVQSASDIPAAATSLCGRVDCINNFTDNNVVNNLSVVLEAANAAGIPVYGSEVEQVKNGCLAAVSIDYVALGKVTGRMALEIIGGKNPGEMAVEKITDALPVINTDVAAALSVSIPEDYAGAETVTTNK